MKLHRHVKRVLLEGLGWILVAVGIAAIILPGPGLLITVGGLALLATQYEWAERRLAPIQKFAMKSAAQSVETTPQIVVSIIFSMLLVTAGIVWGVGPEAPRWWFLDDKWWLKGGWATGATLIFSGVLALGILAYSYIKFHETKHKHK